jgi:hypothetical protein
MKTKLTHKEMMNAFSEATAGKRVNMTVNEVAALVDSIEAESHNQAVNEILIELGWKEREVKAISKITIRYNGNDITADGTHQSAGTIIPAEAIEKANTWAASDKGHVDFVGGQYDVWADYEDGESEHIHSTNVIA